MSKSTSKTERPLSELLELVIGWRTTALLRLQESKHSKQSYIESLRAEIRHLKSRRGTV